MLFVAPNDRREAELRRIVASVLPRSGECCRFWTTTVAFVNGELRQLNAPATVADLLRHLELPFRGVAVEVNLEIIPRARHAAQLLTDGDRLEIVSLVGGG